MNRRTIATAATAVALASAVAAAAAFAYDVQSLRSLDQERRIEAISTSNVSLGQGVHGGELKSLPVAVLRARGSSRDVAAVIFDLRGAYRPGFMATFYAPEIHAADADRAEIRRHPVVRIAGTVDCGTGEASWTSIDHADDATGPVFRRTTVKDPHSGTMLPHVIAPDARASICGPFPADEIRRGISTDG